MAQSAADPSKRATAAALWRTALEADPSNIEARHLLLAAYEEDLDRLEHRFEFVLAQLLGRLHHDDEWLRARARVLDHASPLRSLSPRPPSRMFSAPPRHSVTSSPVNSIWMPPG